MRRIVLTIMMAASPCLVVYAQPMERLTAGDIFRRDINDFFHAKNELTRTVGEMNAEFAAARKELAEATPGTPAHTEAQQKLDKLELGKNLSLLSLYLPYGVTTSSEMAMQIPEMLGGAKLAGGIPSEARPAFYKWVRSLRSSFGKGDGEFLMLSDSQAHVDQLMKALVENESAYTAYVKAAEQARINEAKRRQDRINLAIANQKKFEQAKLPGGAIAFSHSKTEFLMDSFDHFTRIPGGEIRKLLFVESMDHGQKMLHCSYGPVPTSTNQITYQVHYFWYEKTPANLDELMRLDNEGALANLSKQPRTECPPNVTDRNRRGM